MIAVDTNVLVYAHRRDDARHSAAHSALERLAAAGPTWAIPWPCLHEFYAVTTHRRVFDPPSTASEALTAITDLAGAPGALIIGEGAAHLDILSALVRSSGIVGPKVHDARIAAICMGHGVSELWTADRDFSLFPHLRTRNPLVVQ